MPASPDGNTEGVSFVFELIQGIISLLNAVGVGVIANYIIKRIDKWIDSNSAGKNKKS